MGLQLGEIIRTQGEAAAQVDLKNGLAFRIRGDASLKIQPNNRLNLTAGDMITWVPPGLTLPAEIITPTAVAGIRGTTVFVKIPSDPKGETEFFSWEGTVSVRLLGQTEEILLKTGDEVKIRRGETDINQIRKRVRRFTPQEFTERQRNNRFLRNFKQPLPTLKLIETLQPGQVVSDLKSSKAMPLLVADLKRKSLNPEPDLKQPAELRRAIEADKKSGKASQKMLQKARAEVKRDKAGNVGKKILQEAKLSRSRPISLTPKEKQRG